MEGLTNVTDLEDEGECSILEDQGNVILTEIESADPSKELEVQGEVSDVVTYNCLEAANYF